MNYEWKTCYILGYDAMSLSQFALLRPLLCDMLHQAAPHGFSRCFISAPPSAQHPAAHMLRAIRQDCPHMQIIQVPPFPHLVAQRYHPDICIVFPVTGLVSPCTPFLRLPDFSLHGY